MTAEQLLNEFKENNSLSTATIEYLDTDEKIGKELVFYFRKNKNRDLALHLLEKAIEIRSQPYPNGYDMSGVILMLFSYILGMHKNMEDCLKIWEAKTVDFDTFCLVDIQLVVFAGLEETIAFFKSQESDESKDALKYVEECKEAGDFENIENYFSEVTVPWFV